MIPHTSGLPLYVEKVHGVNPDPVYQSKAYKRGKMRRDQFMDRRKFEEIFKEVRDKVK